MPMREDLSFDMPDRSAHQAAKLEHTIFLTVKRAPTTEYPAQILEVVPISLHILMDNYLSVNGKEKPGIVTVQMVGNG
jgi:hypothetical protein